MINNIGQNVLFQGVAVVCPNKIKVDEIKNGLLAAIIDLYASHLEHPCQLDMRLKVDEIKNGQLAAIIDLYASHLEHPCQLDMRHRKMHPETHQIQSCGLRPLLTYA